MMELKAKHPKMVMKNPVQRTGGGIEQVQADWTQTDETAVDYIKNKPDVFRFEIRGNLAVAEEDFPINLTCDTPAQEIVDAFNNGKELEPVLINTAYDKEKQFFGGFFTFNNTSFSYNLFQLFYFAPSNSQKFTKYKIVQKKDVWQITAREIVLTPIPAYENKNTIQLLASKPNWLYAPQWVEVEDLVEPQIQADWDQENQEAVDYIKNKPTALSDFENDVGFITQGLPDASEFEDGTGLVAIDKKFRTTAGFPYRGKLFDDINWRTPIPETYLDSVSDDGVYTLYKISDKVFKTEQLNADTIIVSGQAIGTTQKIAFTKYFYGDGFTSIGASSNASLHQVYNIERPVDVQTEKNGGITHFTSAGLWVKGMTTAYDFTLQSKIKVIPMGEEFFPEGVPKYNNYFDITQPEDLTPVSFEKYDQMVEDGLAFRIKDHPSFPNNRYYFVKFSNDFLNYDTLLNSYYDTTLITDMKITESSFQKREDGYIGVGGTSYSPFGIISVAEGGQYQSWFYADDIMTIPDKGTYCLMTVSAQGTNTHIIHMYKEVIKLDNLFLDTDYINSLIDDKLGVIENGTY